MAWAAAATRIEKSVAAPACEGLGVGPVTSGVRSGSEPEVQAISHAVTTRLLGDLYIHFDVTVSHFWG